MSQAAIGRELGLSPATMSKLKRAGCPMGSVEAVATWRRQNVAPYAGSSPPPPRSEAERAPLAGSGLDLAAERAALARAQREGFEIKNAVLRGQYAPISLLAEVLATASQAVAERFDHLPGVIKKSCPHLTHADREQIMGVIADARNAWVHATCELVAQRVEAFDDEADEQDDPPPAAPEALGGEAMSYHEAKRRLAVAEMLQAERAEREQAGELIRVQAVRDALALDFATTRDGFTQIPSRMGPALAAETDPAAIERMLSAEIHHALARLAGAADAVGAGRG